MKYRLTLFIIILWVGNIYAQQHKETIHKEIVFPEGNNPVFIIENIFGEIEVEGYAGDKVILEIENEYNADTPKELEEAIQKLYLTMETHEDTVGIFIDGVCGCHQKDRRNFNWGQCDFDYKFDFKVKVPASANLRLSTVNEGDVKVNNVVGEVFIRNVNGGIFVNNISGPTDVHTINGPVEVRYSKNPNKHSKYYSLNGDVSVYYSHELAADMTFKSFQGDMYTNFHISKWLPPIISSTRSKTPKGNTYKIENKAAVRVGKGGVMLDFETFNGDVFVRKI